MGFRRHTPTSPRHRPKLSVGDVVSLLKSGAYTVNPATAEVRNRRGQIIGGFLCGREGKKYRYVRVHGKAPDGRLGVKTLPVSKLVWISVTRREVPKGFQLHHRDRDTTNDSWPNLLCVHELDHVKLHAADAPENTAVTPAEDPIPF